MDKEQPPKSMDPETPLWVWTLVIAGAFVGCYELGFIGIFVGGAAGYGLTLLLIILGVGLIGWLGGILALFSGAGSAEREERGHPSDGGPY